MRIPGVKSNVATVVMVSMWAAAIWARMVGMVPWPWWMVLFPIVAPVVCIVFLWLGTAAFALLNMAIGQWDAWRARRRRVREQREILSLRQRGFIHNGGFIYRIPTGERTVRTLPAERPKP